MPRRLVAILALATATLAGSACQTTTTTDRERQRSTMVPAALALAEVSGVGPLLERAARAPGVLISHLRTQVKRLDPNAMPDLEQLNFSFYVANQAAHLFDAKTLQDAGFAVLVALPEDERVATLRYYQSAPRERLDAAMADLATTGGQRRMMLFLRDLDQHPPEQERLNLLDALVVQSGDVDRRVMASYDAAQEFLLAIAPALPDGLRPNATLVRKERETFVNRNRRTMVIELDAITRNFSLDELAALVRFWQTPDGVAFRLASERAVRLGIGAAARRASAETERLLAERAAQKAAQTSDAAEEETAPDTPVSPAPEPPKNRVNSGASPTPDPATPGIDPPS